MISDRGKYKSIHQRQFLRLVGYDAGPVEDRRSEPGSFEEPTAGSHNSAALLQSGIEPVEARLIVFVSHNRAPLPGTEPSRIYSTMVEIVFRLALWIRVAS